MTVSVNFQWKIFMILYDFRELPTSHHSWVNTSCTILERLSMSNLDDVERDKTRNEMLKWLCKVLDHLLIVFLLNYIELSGGVHESGGKSTMRVAFVRMVVGRRIKLKARHIELWEDRMRAILLSPFFKSKTYSRDVPTQLKFLEQLLGSQQVFILILTFPFSSTSYPIGNTHSHISILSHYFQRLSCTNISSRPLAVQYSFLFEYHDSSKFWIVHNHVPSTTVLDKKM